MRIEKRRWWEKKWFNTTSSIKKNDFLLPTSRNYSKNRPRKAIRKICMGLVALLFLTVTCLAIGSVFTTTTNLNVQETTFRQFVFRSLMDSLPQVVGNDESSTNTIDDNKNITRPITINRVLIYPAAHVDENAASVVDGVEEIVQALSRDAHEAPKVVLHKVDNNQLQPPLPHFPMGTAYMYQLMQERSTIPYVQYTPGEWHEDYTNINSLNEMQRLMRYCEANEIEALIVVSTPFHLPRSFLSALSVLAKQQSSQISPDLNNNENDRHRVRPLRIYAKAAQPREYNYWNRIVSHSQGTLVGARSEFVETERLRIEKYIRAGDLIPLEEALQMLQERDSID